MSDNYEDRLNTFMEKVHALRDEFADCVTSYCMSVVTVLPEGKARTCGSWSVPSDQPHEAYGELADFHQEEFEDQLTTIRHLGANAEGQHYDA